MVYYSLYWKRDENKMSVFIDSDIDLEVVKLTYTKALKRNKQAKLFIEDNKGNIIVTKMVERKEER